MWTAEALIVVDVQRAFVEGAEAVPGAQRLVGVIEGLLNSARDSGALVVHLQNDGPAGAMDEVGTAGWELALPVRPDETIVRKQSDDGFLDTDLGASLVANKVRTIAICGVQSEMCVAATARAAQQRGLAVILPRNAHATYPIPADDDGGVAVPAAHVGRVAEWSLGDQVRAPSFASGFSSIEFEPGASW